MSQVVCYEDWAEARIKDLEEENAMLKASLAQLARELGVNPPGDRGETLVGIGLTAEQARIG